MKKLFVNSHGQIRNGYWIIIFVIFVAITSAIYTPVSKGLQSTGFPKDLLGPVSVFFLLLATWGCLAIRRETLSDVGLGINKKWFFELMIGVALGALWLASVALILWVIGAVSFQFNQEITLLILLQGLYVFIFGALSEELLLRGFAFQRLIDGTNFWIAQLVCGLLFAIGHWDNPNMGGLTKILGSLDMLLAAFIFGIAYFRTRSLALPIGLHIGWNWFQGNFMGFNVSGHENSGILLPVYHDFPDWLTGGQFGIESGLFSILSSVIVLIFLWKWKGFNNIEPSKKILK